MIMRSSLQRRPCVSPNEAPHRPRESPSMALFIFPTLTSEIAPYLTAACISCLLAATIIWNRRNNNAERRVNQRPPELEIITAGALGGEIKRRAFLHLLVLVWRPGLSASPTPGGRHLLSCGDPSANSR